MGGAGRGMGGVATVEADQVAFQKERIKGDLQAGAILASFKVDGEQIPGESNIQYTETYQEYRQVAEDTMEKERLPLEYKNLVADYFDSIKPQVGSDEKADSGAAAAKP